MTFDLSMPILVVDDYPNMVRIVQALLQQIGFSDVDGAGDGEGALERIRQKRYGIVIADLIMEPMSGQDLLRAIRSDSSLARTPFIMMTADSRIEHVVAARKAGVDGYMVKPFDATALRAKIETVFGD